ncbi:interleukin-12 subunit beta [Sorex fumeus]|uniref:interleukin-12 subunit beta n=1 Tax=Sorex fumeus TaxID=62283 RepID=UPI0024ADB148|nr:interleukin-12 subunit beta [Sorex fumeus]
MSWQHLFVLWVSLAGLVAPLTALWQLKKDVYVVELDWHPDAPGETVVLSCDAPAEADVTWTWSRSDEPVGRDPTLRVDVTEFGDAGQYTCHVGGEPQSRWTLLLHKWENGLWSTDILKAQKEPKQKTYLRCEAKNYSGHFTCSWLTAIGSNLDFSVKSSRGSSDPREVTCGAATASAEKVRVDHREYTKYTVECREGSACPAAEETHPVEIVLDAVHKLKYENYTSSFFIRDIIKPDPPKNLQLMSVPNSPSVSVSWEYPDSWSTPHSYFSLTFNVQVLDKTGNEEKDRISTDTTSAKVKCPKDGKIQVQARDRYYGSSWSEWASVPCS